MGHNALLFGDYPIMVTKELATLLGLNEAIVLQQVHYWCNHNERAGNNFRDGYYWCFNAYTKWHEEFPWWGDKTIRTTFRKLENLGLLVTGNYNRVKMDRTKWYRIDYDALDALIAANYPPPETENPQPFGKNYRMESANITEPIPETIKKIRMDFRPYRRKPLVILMKSILTSLSIGTLPNMRGYTELSIRTYEQTSVAGLHKHYLIS